MTNYKIDAFHDGYNVNYEGNNLTEVLHKFIDLYTSQINRVEQDKEDLTINIKWRSNGHNKESVLEATRSSNGV